MRKLIQIKDDDLEELYNIDCKITDNMIKSYWKDYIKSNHDSFEEYLKQHSLKKGIDRIFVNEIIM